MAKRRYSIAASDERATPVIAMFKNSDGPKAKTYLALLSCDDCKTEIVANNMHSPKCPCCTGKMHPVSDKTMEHSKAQIKSMTAIGICTACDTKMVQPTDMLASFDSGKVYCPVCTNPVLASDPKKKPLDEDEEEDENEDTTSDDEDELSDDEGEDTVDDDEGLFNQSEGEGDEVEDTTAESTDDTTSEDSGDSTESAESTKDSGTTEEGNMSKKTEDTSTDTPVDNSSSEDTTSTDTSMGDDTTGGSESSDTVGTSVNADLVQMMAGKEGSVSIVASPDKSKWVLFMDGTPIANASKENASENMQKLFDSDKFATAWEAATADGVTEDILGDFGFTSIKTDVPVTEAVAQELNASIAKEKKKYNLMASEYSARYQRCMGIAAVGVNKGFFKEENPVKTALVASMKGFARIRNPEVLVSNAYAQHGQQYLKNIVLKATELMEKTDETLDEIAKMVDEAPAKVEPLEEEKVEKSQKVVPITLKLGKEEEKDKEEDKVTDEDGEKPTELAASDNNVEAIDLLFGRFGR